MNQPKVTVMMAVYNPNEEYFRKQLISINNQTYSNLELIICVDSGDQSSLEFIRSFVETYISNFKFTILNNTKNLGSNKTFERLTLEATGDYISYSDQDDIWEKDKIQKLVFSIIEDDGVLAYSDLSLIDENDNLINTSFKKSNFRMKHVLGKDCFFRFLRRNSVTGCTMLIKSEIAKASIPFPDKELYPHDHWLAICSATEGKIVYVNEALVKYRIHSDNQIGNKRFIGINNLEEYYKERIIVQNMRLNYILNSLELNCEQLNSLGIEKEFLNCRSAVLKDINIRNLYKLGEFAKYDLVLICFEITISIIPEKYTKKFFHKLKR